MNSYIPLYQNPKQSILKQSKLSDSAFADVVFTETGSDEAKLLAR
jgi:hypothetical protein